MEVVTGDSGISAERTVTSTGIAGASEDDYQRKEQKPSEEH
jgi:hypothetical protein